MILSSDSANSSPDFPALHPSSRHVSCDIDPFQPAMNPTPSGISGPDDAALNSTLESDMIPSNPYALPPTDMTSEIDRRLHDVGVAALAAVSQFPRAENDAHDDSFMVSEVVNAVTSASSPPGYYRHMESGGSLLSVHRGHFHQSGMGGTSSAGPGFVFGSNPSGNVDMEAIVRGLIHRTAGRQNIAVAPVHDVEDGHKDMVMDYESATMEDNRSPESTSDDELEDFLQFYPDEEDYYYQRKNRPTHEAEMPDCDLDDFYNSMSYEDIEMDLSQNISLSIAEPLQHYVDEQMEFPGPRPASIIHTSTYERNLTIDEFVKHWMVSIHNISHGFHAESRIPPQLRPLAKMISWQPPPEVVRPSRWTRDFYDLQQIPWAEILRVTRSDARAVRDAWYIPYRNLHYLHPGHAKHLPQHETFFRERSMHTSHKASIEHFQLRNLMSTPASNTVHFASRSKVFSWTPTTGDARCLIDMSQADPESGFLGPVKISTMKTAHGLTIAGGFCGEYALRSTSASDPGIKGLVTPDFNDGITNHVDIIPNRTGPSPTGVFASNDRHLRILDTETNIFTSDQELAQPINCTATSPDSRLRVVIGDSPDAWVIESDTGRPVHPLRGHRDFGFACAWSPDMRHIATSNQDKTVIIWDARTWRPLETIDSDVAGYRSLRFSPVGGGPRTLLCTEPADRISIVDAQLFRSRQVHDFFGEIGGADYAPDGAEIWVANTDSHFGGFMQYERKQSGRRVGLTDLPSEWVTEEELAVDPRCVLSKRERRLRFLRNLSDEEHDALIL